MTTPLFLLRCYQLGISLDDQDRLDMGLVMDMFTEQGNDSEGYDQIADQSDFDNF